VRRLVVGVCLAVVVAATGFVQPSPQISVIPPVPGDIPASRAVHTVIMLAGHQAGDSFLWKSADGNTHVFLQYNDRGRGPKTEATYTVNAQGWPTSVAITGVDYWKKPIDERFTFDGQTSTWTSSNEQGRASGLTGFYYSAAGTAEEQAMRVHAARRQDGRLPLIPGGEIQVSALRTETVDVAGTPVPVTLYSVAGLSFAPYTIWLDADDQFFAAPGSWLARVRAGAEASLPKLQAIEEELQKKSVADSDSSRR